MKSLEEQICNLICELEHEIKMVRLEAAKASSKCDHLGNFQWRLQKALDESKIKNIMGEKTPEGLD